MITYKDVELELRKNNPAFPELTVSKDFRSVLVKETGAEILDYMDFALFCALCPNENDLLTVIVNTITRRVEAMS